MGLRPYLSEMKEKGHQKKTLRPLALPFLEQLQVHLRNLLQCFLHLNTRNGFSRRAGGAFWRVQFQSSARSGRLSVEAGTRLPISLYAS